MTDNGFKSLSIRARNAIFQVMTDAPYHICDTPNIGDWEPDKAAVIQHLPFKKMMNVGKKTIAEINDYLGVDSTKPPIERLLPVEHWQIAQQRVNGDLTLRYCVSVTEKNGFRCWHVIDGLNTEENEHSQTRTRPQA